MKPTSGKKQNWPRTHNEVRLVRGGSEYFDLLVSLIDEAKESIHLQVYIFDSDHTGRMVADALMRAAARKIQVYVLVDGYASQSLSRHLVNDMRSAGVQFRYFEALFKSRQFYFGRRMHHKVFVVDGKKALVGGINIADRYNDLPGIPAWLDFALLVSGEIVVDLCVLCWKTWKGFPVNMSTTRCEENTHLTSGRSEPLPIRMRRNDWVRRKNEISGTYIHMFRSAKKSITILCSYFLPGRLIRKLISMASSRGVRVKIIMAGNSDIALAKHAERWLYDWLLRHGIELYEYQPTILHAKAAVCDGEWMSLGSYNINNISAYASIELNLDIDDARFASEMEEHMEEIISKDCIQVTPQWQHRTKNPFIQFNRWLSYHLIRVIFYMLTFYYKRVRGKKIHA